MIGHDKIAVLFSIKKRTYSIREDSSKKNGEKNAPTQIIKTMPSGKNKKEAEAAKSIAKIIIGKTTIP